MSFPTRLSTRTTSNTPLPYFCRPTRTRTSLNASEDSSVQTESTTSLQQRAFRWSIVKESLSLGMVLAPRMKRSRNNIKMSKVPDCSQAHPFTLFFLSESPSKMHTPPFKTIALLDIETDEPDEISFKKGQEITIVELDGIYRDGWFVGETANSRGLVHQNYLQIEPQESNVSELSMRPSEWSKQQVREWLDCKGFSHLTALFDAVDGSMLLNMSLAQLREMKVENLADRINLLHEILLLGENFRLSMLTVPSLSDEKFVEKGSTSSEYGLEKEGKDSEFVDLKVSRFLISRSTGQERQYRRLPCPTTFQH